MSPELPPLSEEQQALAAQLLEICGLEDVANRVVTMAGIHGTVAYGLGRCAEHFAHLTPDAIKAMVQAKLNATDGAEH